MANSHHHPVAAPLGGRLLTPTAMILVLLAAIALALLGVRFSYGLGAVTNINDGYPWGIWVVYDIVIGSALACGGYAIALLVYIFNKGEYHPLVRPALLGSIFGYTLAGVSVIFDLGRYWNFWHIFAPGYANVRSVMFEVALCITAYILVMWIEFSPAFLEKWGKEETRKKLNKALFFIIALGVLLPSMHQSSLGSLLVVFGYQVNGLWQTLLLPLLYLLSALTMGFAVVLFEATLSANGFRRPMELPILAKVGNVMKTVMIAYLVIRFGDIVARGALPRAFQFDLMALMFWIENALYVASVALLVRPQARRNPQKLFLSSICMMLGGALYRLNSYLIGYETGPGWTYFPSLAELMVTVGIVALEILAYIVFVRHLPVLPAEPVAPAAVTATR